jgi:hypothetical protein
MPVRAAFETMGVLQFEHMPDSTQDESVTLPPMMAEFLAGMAQANAPAA